MTASAMTLTGPAAPADPSAAAIGLAKTTIGSASMALVMNEIVVMADAMASRSTSARIRQAAMPSSPRADTIA